MPPVTLSVGLFATFVLLTGGERIHEMFVSSRNARWAFERGGIETNRRQLPWMIALHVSLLLGAVAEAWLLGRPFLPTLGWPMLVIALACQAARLWIMRSLGSQWNTRVIVVPGLPLVAAGPYQWSRLPHPNYLVVAIEGIALPLVHTAWITAIAFTVLNAVLLIGFRIPAEDSALSGAARIGTGVHT
jgi:methyltransferase